MATLEVSDVPVPPKDERFPSTNQALNCWNKYNEWLMCVKKNEGDETKCYLPRIYAKSVCPSDWSEKWDEDREKGTFPGLGFRENAEH